MVAAHHAELRCYESVLRFFKLSGAMKAVERRARTRIEQIRSRPFEGLELFSLVRMLLTSCNDVCQRHGGCTRFLAPFIKF